MANWIVTCVRLTDGHNRIDAMTFDQIDTPMGQARETGKHFAVGFADGDPDAEKAFKLYSLRRKIIEAGDDEPVFVADPSAYHISRVANGAATPLDPAGIVEALPDLVHNPGLQLYQREGEDIVRRSLPKTFG